MEKFQAQSDNFYPVSAREINSIVFRVPFYDGQLGSEVYPGLSVNIRVGRNKSSDH